VKKDLDASESKDVGRLNSVLTTSTLCAISRTHSWGYLVWFVDFV